MWAGLRRHPWVVDVAVGPRVMGPNELGWLETGLSALSGTGLTGGERLDSVVLITGHVRSLAQQSTAPGAETDTPEKALNALMTGILTDNSERYPEAAAAFASARSSSGQDDALEFGLAGSSTASPHSSRSAPNSGPRPDQVDRGLSNTAIVTARTPPHRSPASAVAQRCPIDASVEVNALTSIVAAPVTDRVTFQLRR